MLRRYKSGDLERIKALHAKQGFNYPLPDVEDELFLEKLVVEGESGVEMALLLRLTSEAYLLHDGEAGTPRERWENFLELHEAMRLCAKGKGLADVQIWLPPELTKKAGRGFEKRLRALRWCPNEWKCFWRDLEP